jgi:uncharacterized SAM-binding protein YcdF (DUF218 family)
LIAAGAGVWLVAFYQFASGLPQGPDRPDETTEAIVVLTGGSERLAEGLSLLAEGHAGKLFVSGVYRGVDVAELLTVTRSGGGSVANRIALGHDADDTRGNARETAAWMTDEGFSRLRLVTAAYHMPRSLFEFRQAMPDVVVIAHPVYPENVRLDAWWRYPGTFSLLAGEFSKLLLAQTRVWSAARWRDLRAWVDEKIG